MPWHDHIDKEHYHASRTDHRRLARASAAPSPPTLAAAGWSLVARRPRRPTGSPSGRRGLRRRTASRRAGRRRRPGAPRRRSSTRPRPVGGLDLLVNNASDLGPSPLPRARRLPARRARARLRGRRARAARADPARCCPHCGAADGAVVNVSSDAAVEAYDGWGGYGVGQGGARPPHRGARRRAAGRARVRRSTRATCAPRCTSRRSRARTSPTGPSPSRRPGPAAPARRAAGQRPLPGRRAGRCAAVGAVSRRVTAAPSARRHPSCRAPSVAPPSRPRPAASPATGCGCWSPRPRPGRHTPVPRPARLPAPGDLLVVNTSATLAAASTAPRRRRPVTVHFATALPDGDLGRRAAAAPTATDRCATRGRASRSALRGGGCTLLERIPTPDGARSRLWRAGVSPADAASCALPGRGTAGRSPTATCRRLAAARLPDGLRPRARAAPRCPAPARPFTDRAGDRPGRAAASRVAPVMLHTGVSSLETGEPPLPERFGVPARRRRLVNPTRAARRPGGRGRDDGDPRAGVGGRAGRHASAPAPAGPTSSSARTARPAWSTGWSPAGTPPAPRTCCCSRRSPGRASCGGAYDARSRARLPLARVRRQRPAAAVASKVGLWCDIGHSVFGRCRVREATIIPVRPIRASVVAAVLLATGLPSAVVAAAADGDAPAASVAAAGLATTPGAERDHAAAGPALAGGRRPRLRHGHRRRALPGGGLAHPGRDGRRVDTADQARRRHLVPARRPVAR